MKRVTSPFQFLILGLASIVAVFFLSSLADLLAGFMILGGAESTLGLAVEWGANLSCATPSGAPGGLINRGGGPPAGDILKYLSITPTFCCHLMSGL